MAFEDDFDPDWLHDAPFYIVAVMAHGAILFSNPTLRWGSAQKALDMAVPIEFVARVPPASADLAPAPAVPAKTESPPRHGPGEYRPEKVKAGAVAPPPKPLPNPKPAALAAKKEKKGNALAKVKPPAKPRPPVKAQAARMHAEMQRAEREQARALAAQKAAEVRAERAAKARRKAELSQELATMADPDEVLDSGGGAPAAARAARGAKGGGGGVRAGGASESVVSAAAALAETAESPDPGDAAGSGGADLLDAKPRGGGSGPEGGGVSWSLDGPVGSRRVLSREVPTSPDWVGTRGLDLSVTVRFRVMPDGSVKPGAVILKTSGFPEIDRRGLDALRRWRFETVPDKSAPEVWGRVTFRFTS